MKIDLTGQLASQLSAEASTKQVTNGTITIRRGVTQDRTTFSADSTSLDALTREALQAPQVRQDKVDAVRQSLNSGAYQVDATKIAAAIVSSSAR